MRRRLATIGGPVGLALLSAATILGSVSQAIASQKPAHAAGAVSVSDESRLHLVRASGSVLSDEGTARGALPGTVKVRFTYNGDPTVIAQITIYARGGTILAHGSGRLSSPSSPSPSFKGMLSITGGSGRYARAHGSGEMFGVFYRRSYAITVQTRGTLHY